MCGIAGALFWDAAEDPRSQTACVSRMVTALGHRGPDGCGVVRCSNAVEAGPACVLGHTRLSILDLSERGAQPMQSAANPIWISYNGEVYNFADIRRELQMAGREFRSSSDTEVVLQAYEAWGPDMIERLRGMFALAVWDGRTRELLLARDRVGIKPLYWAETDRQFLFGSEVRALLASDRVARKLDHLGVAQYLAHQTVPTPRTLVQGIRMLEPGQVMRIAADRQREVRSYWHLLDAADTRSQLEEQEGKAEVRRLLIDSMRLHLISDVPVGIFLSGGIDSSALVALAHEAGVTPRSFTVVLPGSVHDEARFARSVAARFDAEHTEISVSDLELRDLVTNSFERVDHPSGDGFNTFVVSQAVRKAGVKVALSGLGGDEIFGGYPSFRRFSRFASYAKLWGRSPATMRTAIASAVRIMGGGSVGATKAAALLETDGSVPHAFPLLRELLSEGQRRELLDAPVAAAADAAGDPYEALLEEAVDRHPDADLMSQIVFAEARTYMHDVLLRDADQMSMAWGLEVRVPLLDHKLIECVMALDSRLKEPREQPKRLLVESLGSALPAQCVDRPKQGFVLPFDDWMRGSLRPFCEERLGRHGLGGRGLFNGAAIDRLWRSFLAADGRTTWARVWALVSLDAWIDHNRLSA